MLIRTPVILLANGAFPTHPYPLKLLAEAKTLICTDGSYHALKKTGLEPTVIIGDMDSIAKESVSDPDKLLEINNPNNSDTAKALDWCIAHQIEAVTLLGSTGLREDHHLANVFLMQQYATRISIQIVTDHCLIRCLQGFHTLKSSPKQIVSLIAPVATTRITTQGLQYPLLDELLQDASHGMSNIALESTFSITSDLPVFVFQQLI